jgi:hypothetical protein
MKIKIAKSGSRYYSTFRPGELFSSKQALIKSAQSKMKSHEEQWEEVLGEEQEEKELERKRIHDEAIEDHFRELDYKHTEESRKLKELWEQLDKDKLLKPYFDAYNELNSKSHEEFNKRYPRINEGDQP